MTNTIHLAAEDQRDEKYNILTEVSEKEKRLLMLIHAKGPREGDVRELYRKVRSSYETIILRDGEQSGVHELEYCLWKLHYKHIDEFRKSLAKSSSSDAEAFRIFLSEATEFYQSLVVKIRKRYRLPDESSFYRTRLEPESKKINQCHFLCHRFLVCLGDLARYREQYDKPDAGDRNWSMAATYYLEATAIWPDSGTPHNQLAVLATYVGDEFLALYHCIRSLAVKEPFPDARDNLTVLLERNRSSSSLSITTEAPFNFMKPSERCNVTKNSRQSGGFSFNLTCTSISENACSEATNVWSLFIRLISFFFIESSLDDFPLVFASVMRELEGLMALEDQELRASLESYREMESVRKGPFRSLQAVSIFVYALQSLTEPALRQWAIPAAFIFMGRIVERCSEAGPPSSRQCPLLPAVLVFAEWLADNFEENSASDEKGNIAGSYFLAAFSDLVKRLRRDSSGEEGSTTTPLWEDYELRGFTPVSRPHDRLDFSSTWECVEGFEKGTECRARRIISAGTTISDKSGGRSSEAVEEEEVILFSPPRQQSSPAGFPSLSAWVVEGESHVSVAKKHALSSIEEESASESLYGLSIGRREDSPAPSAPMLPKDDAAWYPLGWTTAEYVPAPAPPPQQRPLTSAEWLRQYLHTNQHAAAPVVAWPWPVGGGYYYAPCGGGYEQRAASPYTTEVMIGEPQPQSLLQYLKERERLLHAQNPTYLG